MNYILMVLCIIVILAFRTSAHLGRAYGEAAHHLSNLRSSLGKNRAPLQPCMVRAAAGST